MTKEKDAFIAVASRFLFANREGGRNAAMHKVTDKRVEYLRSRLDYSSVELLGRTLLSVQEYDVNHVAEADPLQMLAYMDELIAVLDSEQDVGLNDADCDLLMMLDRVEAIVGPWQEHR